MTISYKISDEPHIREASVRGEGHGHDQGHGHGHGEKIKRFAKVLIGMECPLALYSYNFRYMLGVKGSFYTGFSAESWVFYTNVSVFVASAIAVIIGVMADSLFQRYIALVIGFFLSMISSVIIFVTSVARTGQYEKPLNTVGLFWGCFFIAIEPLRTAVVFDQLPAKMDAHQAGHVFLMFQEMKTAGSLIYTVLSFTIGGKGYGKTPLPLAIIYFVIPVAYFIVILSFWKAHSPGEFSYCFAFECITCFCRAIHLKFMKQSKPEGHWLDAARDAYDSKTVRNTKIMSSLTFIYITLISYGMALVLMKNSWDGQAQGLIEDLDVKGYYKNINTVYFILTILILPFIEDLLLPQIYKRRKDGKPFTELQRIGITMFMTGIAFVMTTVLQLEMEKYSSVVPSGTKAQVRLFNIQDVTVTVEGTWVFDPTKVAATDMIEAWNLKSRSTSLYTITVQSEAASTSKKHNINYTSLMATEQGESLSYLIGERELLRVRGIDPIVFGPIGTNEQDKVRIYLINYWDIEGDGHRNMMNPGDKLTFKNINEVPRPKYDKTINVPPPFEKSVFQLYPGNYTIVCPPEVKGITEFTCVSSSVKIERGGIYAILPIKRVQTVNKVLMEDFVFKLYTINHPAVYSIYLMLPQMFVQAFAVAMGKIPINLFIYKESPLELRVLSLGLYYFSQDGSSIFFAMFHEVFRFRVDSFQLVLVTGIHLVFCFFFTFAALKHQKFPDDEGTRRRRAFLGSTVLGGNFLFGD